VEKISKFQSLSFEEAFKKLEQIADRLENGDITLDESMDVFEEGMALIKVCNERLEKAETRLKKLIKDEDGFQLEIMELE
jgi:exodeoxyribonuclease VII small subunit